MYKHPVLDAYAAPAEGCLDCRPITIAAGKEASNETLVVRQLVQDAFTTSMLDELLLGPPVRL